MNTVVRRQYRTAARRSMRIPIAMDESVLQISRKQKCSYSKVVVEAIRMLIESRNGIATPAKKALRGAK